MAAKNNRHLQFICLLACFLFAFAVTADPLLHSHDHDEGYQVECQFCKSDVPVALITCISDSVTYLTSPQPFEIFENRPTATSYSYSPRAPPII